MDEALTDAEVAAAGERFLLLPERAALWEARGALLVADLHWGRESALQRHGLAVPAGGLADDMARLDRALARTAARALYVLGDWFHHRDGLDPRTVADVTHWWSRWADKVALVALLGNHDRGTEALLATLGADVRRGGFVDGAVGFVHAPDAPVGADFAWCGHLHPAVRLPSRVGQTKLPCFWVTATRGHLPAFSAAAAGALVRPRPGDRVFAVTERAVRAFPHGPRRARSDPPGGCQTG